MASLFFISFEKFIKLIKFGTIEAMATAMKTEIGFSAVCM